MKRNFSSNLLELALLPLSLLCRLFFISVTSNINDLITGTLLKNLPREAIVLLTTIYNGILRLSDFLVQWKYAQIIMIAKPGKSPTETNSYRPISLLPTLSKVFERFILKRLEETVHINDIIPVHHLASEPITPQSNSATESSIK
jgi:hypothetical protein